ncbi:hypothetical protein GQX73_g588 [Xylaria multiplex]|uniref:CCHC-type domain-containing protein n=1 Tax=Xylaria multiplex TaxID=323545 RepID=A0A7C8IV33_9PEZI|nr:hypothetical protein GQX73_g588 [Xylaria multiplex]
MADRPPGYEHAAEDHVCYNCGMKGHMFFACPEDTRRVPAGLEASRKRQASGNDYHVPAKRSKGPVVTHYPPPPPLGLPHIPPPPIPYSPRPSYEGFHSGPPPGPSSGQPPVPPTGPPYHQPHHLGHYDQYPPPNTGRSAPRGLPYGSSRDVHEHQFQGPPRAPPSETPYRPPHYDQYDRPGPLTAAPYGRPYSAPPDRYDEQSAGLPQGPPYTATHRAPYQAHFDHYPPAPGVDNYYPGPPQPYPPPHSNIYRNASHYGYDTAPPARLYTASNHESPPPGTNSYQPHQFPPSDPPPYHIRYDGRFIDRPSYEPQRREAHPQLPERRSGESRQNRERHGRRMRYDSPKGRSRSERRFTDQPVRVPSPVNCTPPAQLGKDSTFTEGSKPQQSISDAVLVDMKDTEQYTAEEFSWEEEMIFKELPGKITRDLIREPLPAEWTDDPIMPPKYDKETITSRYINPTNVDDFALSVRETKAWQIMQYHPVFLPHTDVRIEKLWDYEKASNPGPVYNKQSRHSTNNGGSGRQRGKSWGSKTRGSRQMRYSQYHGQSHSSDDQLSYFRPGLIKRMWDQTSYRDNDEPEGENEGMGQKSKISSPEPGEVCESDDQEPTATTKSPSPSWQGDYHHMRQKYQGRIDHLRKLLQLPYFHLVTSRNLHPARLAREVPKVGLVDLLAGVTPGASLNEIHPYLNQTVPRPARDNDQQSFMQHISVVGESTLLQGHESSVHTDDVCQLGLNDRFAS